MTTNQPIVAQRDEPEPSSEFSTTKGLLLLWFGVLAGPAAWALNQMVSYLFVPWACASGTRIMLHLVALAALLLALIGAAIAWRNWRKSGAEWHTAAGGIIGRSRFMALGGFVLSLMFALVIVAQGYTSFMLGPCQ